MKHVYTVGITFSFLLLCNSLSSYADCFQIISQHAEDGLIAGITQEVLNEDISTPNNEESFRILLDEFEECSNSTEMDTYINIFDNFLNLQSGKSGTIWEKKITAILYYNYKINMNDKLKITLQRWYTRTGDAKKYCFDSLKGLDSAIGNTDPLYKDFSIYISFLQGETNMNTEFSYAILDYMFTYSPGQALIVLNSPLSSEEAEDLKTMIYPLIKWHLWKNPKLWQDEDLNLGKATLNGLTSSQYAYVDLFVAEIVTVVHALRTPEVDAFLAQSTHPLVQRREREPYVYVHHSIPE